MIFANSFCWASSCWLRVQSISTNKLRDVVDKVRSKKRHWALNTMQPSMSVSVFVHVEQLDQVWRPWTAWDTTTIDAVWYIFHEIGMCTQNNWDLASDSLAAPHKTSGGASWCRKDLCTWAESSMDDFSEGVFRYVGWCSSLSHNIDDECFTWGQDVQSVSLIPPFSRSMSSSCVD